MDDLVVCPPTNPFETYYFDHAMVLLAKNTLRHLVGDQIARVISDHEWGNGPVLLSLVSNRA